MALSSPLQTLTLTNGLPSSLFIKIPKRNASKKSPRISKPTSKPNLLLYNTDQNPQKRGKKRKNPKESQPFPYRNSQTLHNSLTFLDSNTNTQNHNKNLKLQRNQNKKHERKKDELKEHQIHTYIHQSIDLKAQILDPQKIFEIYREREREKASTTKRWRD